MELPNRCQNALERGDKLSSALLSLSINGGRGLVTQLSLDAGGRTQLPTHRCLLESPVVTQIRVWGGRYDLCGCMIPTISQQIPDLSKAAGEHERDAPAMKSHPILETAEQKYLVRINSHRETKLVRF